MTRVLILTAGFGEGHNAAARNLAAVIESTDGPGQALVCDPFAIASPRINHHSRRAYLSLINRAPRIWSSFYQWLDKHPPFPRHLWFVRKETAIIADLIAREKPAAIASTYPVYGFMLDRLREKGVPLPPAYAIVTDSISIHSMWTRPSWDGWFVPNAETTAVMLGMGVRADRMFECGFPVQKFFAENENQLAPPDLTLGQRPRVLVISHSGVRHAEATARRLMTETDWELTFALGRDEALRNRLTAAAKSRPHPTTVLGWTDQIPRLLMTHHVVISKAGGATTQETIAAHCPMIVNQIVPGQEEGNFELLRSRDSGAYASTPDDVMKTLRSAFAEQGKQWRTWRDALIPLARRHAAADIATHLRKS